MMVTLINKKKIGGVSLINDIYAIYQGLEDQASMLPHLLVIMIYLHI